MDRALPTGTVSLLFTDIEGSTRLLDALRDRYGEVLAEHHRLLREVWARHGGTEVDTEGDAFFVAFATAGAAVAAAADAQRALDAWEDAVRVRIGIHTGTPSVGESGYWGHDVHYAARIAAAAHGGQVVLSAATRALVTDHAVASLGEHALKDFPVPRELFQLVLGGRGPEAFPPLRTGGRASAALPAAAGALFGREADVAGLEALLAEGRRLITVVGPGGSGKTRVAIELAHRVRQRFAGGVVYVPLESLSDGEAIPVAVARSIGLPELTGVTPLARVVEHLRDRDVLLVLDNFEQLLDHAPVVGQLTAAGPGVRALVTSQAPLRLSGERVVALPPLALPTAGDDLDALAAVPSVALLLERAPGFAVTPENAAAVRELCTQLDGMPLALELAATRLPLLGPAALVARLERDLEALGRGARDLPARQRGLRAVLDWTTGLLDPAERELLARLAVFAGGFTVELAESAFGDVFEALATLLDVGLLRRGIDDRLAMTPPVRRYAAEHLADEPAARRAATAALVRLTEPFEDVWPLHVTDGAPVLLAEAANLTDALAWARRADPALHARLAAATGWWMNYADRQSLGREHVEAALATADDLRLRARLHEALGTVSLASIDATASLRAADAWAALGERRRQVSSLFYGVNLLVHADRAGDAVPLAERAVALARGTGETPLVLLAQTALGNALNGLGRRAEALELLRSVLDQAPRDSFFMFWSATTLADVELELGHWADSLLHYGLAAGAAADAGIWLGELIQAETIAYVLGRLGRLEDAANVLGVCDVVRRELSAPLPPMVEGTRPELESLLEPDQRTRGRERAAAIGMRAGFDWVGALARGEIGG